MRKTLTMVVPAFGAKLTLAVAASGWAAAFLHIVGYRRVSFLITATAFSTLATFWTLQVLEALRIQRMVEEAFLRIPKEVQIVEGSDGGRVVLVERHDGEISTFPLPDGYDPRDDDAEALIRALIMEEDLEWGGDEQ